MDKISIDGKEYSKIWLEQHYELQGHAILQLAHKSNSPVDCLCIPNNPQRLSIRELPADDGESQSHYILARLPKSFDKHAPECVFRSNPDLTGQNEHSAAAIRVDKSSGFIDIALDVKLKESAPPGAKKKDKNENKNEEDKIARPKTERNSIGLLGLLSFIISSSGLNKWAPGGTRRDWLEIQSRVQDVCEQVIVKKSKLDQLMFSPPFYRQDQHDLQKSLWMNYIAKTFGGPDNSTFKYGIIFGELKVIESVGTTGKVFSMKIKHMPYAYISLYANNLEVLKNNHPECFDALEFDRNPSLDKIVVLATIGRNTSGFIFADNVALCRVTKHWIPSLSNLFTIAIEQLSRLKKSFEVPLAYDFGKGLFLPDIILDSTQQKRCIEVFLSDDDEYLTGKAHKIEALKGDGYDVLEWHAVKKAPFPEV